MEATEAHFIFQNVSLYSFHNHNFVSKNINKRECTGGDQWCRVCEIKVSLCGFPMSISMLSMFLLQTGRNVLQKHKNPTSCTHRAIKLSFCFLSKSSPGSYWSSIHWRSAYNLILGGHQSINGDFEVVCTLVSKLNT